jgi:glutamate-1-semialdehyde 2,1-aminomutase
MGHEPSHDRLSALLEHEEHRFRHERPRCAELYQRAAQTLAGGVASSFQRGEPWPLYLERGAGAAVWDIDGHRLLDFHNGFGAMVQGHAHPAIGRAVAARYGAGTHLATPGEDAVVVAEELARRWGLPRWRFTGSGSEATMDAIRIARGFTGRDAVVKMLGAYHGHHDTVLVGIDGDAAYGRGIPSAVADLTVSVPYNDAPTLERRIDELAELGRPAACVIMEPAMMLGMALPEPGYLEAARDITRRHGVVLIFDEVKTGFCLAAGGATELYGVRPDVVTLGKALGGGLPCAAVGGKREVMAAVENGSVLQAGTFNGNAFAMAAARANLFEVLTPESHAHLARMARRLVDGLRSALEERGVPGYAAAAGARGCVTLSPQRIVDHAMLAAHDDSRLKRLTWLYALNRGVLLPPARPEQWTLSLAHGEREVDAYVSVFAGLLDALAYGATTARPTTSPRFRRR